MSVLRDLLFLLECAAKDAAERRPSLLDEVVASMQTQRRNPAPLGFGEAFARAFEVALKHPNDFDAAQAEWREGLRRARVASVALDRITAKAGEDRRTAVNAAEEGLIRVMTEHRRERRAREQGGTSS